MTTNGANKRRSLMKAQLQQVVRSFEMWKKVYCSYELEFEASMSPHVLFASL